MSRPGKIALISIASLAGLALIALAAALAIARSDWFKNKVRQKIISVVEDASGGRVEIGQFNYNWRALTAEVGPLVVHGSESSSSRPFFRAEKIQIGLKIISALKKQVDIASLAVDQPEVYVVVNRDGSTNVPHPKIVRSDKNFAEQLLDLKVQHFELHRGFAEYNSQRIPVDIQGNALEAKMAYDATGPRYTGTIASRQTQLSSVRIKSPVLFDVYTKLALEGNSLRVLETSLSSGGANIRLKGAVTDFSAPEAKFDVTAALPVKEVDQAFALPIERAGGFSFQGKARFGMNPTRYNLEGKLTGRGLAYTYKDTRVKQIVLDSLLEANGERVALPDLTVSALGGQFHGWADLADYKKFSLRGEAKSFSLRELATLGHRDTGDLNGILNGTVRVDAVLLRGRLTDIKAESRLNIVPGPRGVPLEGTLAINYDQRGGKIQLGNSEITLGSTHASASGTLGENLAVQLASRNFDDLLPVLPLLVENAPEQLPAALHGGAFRFDGTISGPLDSVRISGKADATRLALDRREFDRLTAAIDVNKSGANLNSVTVEQGRLRVEGQGRIGLHDWKLEESSSIAGLVSLAGADLQKLAAENGIEVPVSGMLSASLQLTGTFDSPVAAGRVDVQNAGVYGEKIDHARADITYTPTSLEVSNGEIQAGQGQIKGSGAYNHPANDWGDGSLRFDLASSGFHLAQIAHVRDFRAGLDGELSLKSNGAAKVVKNAISLTSLNGQVTLQNAVLDGRPYGNIQLTASTRLPVLSVDARVSFGGIQIGGSGEWRMEGDYPGQAHFQIPRVSFATLHDLAPGEHLRKELPFDGFLQGEATITGSVNKLDALRADVTLSTVQLSAGPNAQPFGGLKPQDLVLKNAQPVRFEATLKSIDIRSAEFAATDTTLSVSGRLALDNKNPWDVSAKGRINLSILQIFNPDLLASGASVVDMTVRGPLSEPQIDGRLQLQNASLFLRDFPNGVDQANGLILFDRNRATVQSLSAVTGGGKVAFEPGSFVGFRGTALVYRIQATAQSVRYRSPEGISVTANANVNLTGTSEHSVLSGTVVVERASANPRTDLGSLLAATARPVPISSTPNEYLRGVQLDVNVLSSRSLEVQTSLTRNIQADANLRLRGTPERPVVLGNVTVNSGEIEFFGNKYTINRGVINFYNPVKIEPIIDMDLETRERGIVVNISFSGPLNKLNFSYSSDPPLETNDIIALLAVGRTPSTAGPLASSQVVQSSSYLATGSNALLGQAIAPATGRLQRFFGVSHIKIDPQLTDITVIPQARLTLEQQVSSDITLTYITNLAFVNQQIVRVQWDFSRQWSMVALRDDNGAFSIDFQYRKRFK